MEENVCVNNDVVRRQNDAPSVGDWILTIFLVQIPIVGLIMLFVWGFSSDTVKCKSNWAKATLIWALIGFVLSIFLWIIYGAVLFALFSSMNQ